MSSSFLPPRRLPGPPEIRRQGKSKLVVDCPYCVDGERLGSTSIVNCNYCEGTNEILVDAQTHWLGKELEAIRREEAEMTLRKFCRRFELDPVEVFGVERGAREPTPRMHWAYMQIRKENQHYYGL